MSIRTYSQRIEEERLLELAKEAGKLYSIAIVFFWRVWRKKGIWLKEENIRKYVESIQAREKLHSQAYQAAYQQVIKNLSNYLKAKKAYEKNPAGFSGKPKMPWRQKNLQPIQFKGQGIKVKKGYLELPLAKGNQPIRVRWNKNLPVPKFAMIVWKKNIGWQLSCVLEIIEKEEIKEYWKGCMGVDLGVKRIATTFDGKESITYSGKVIRSLIRLRNKLHSQTETILSKLKKHSRKYKRIKRGYRRVARRIHNKIKDILHKASRTIVQTAIDSNSKTITIGDCSGIHTETHCGHTQNQGIQQNPEQVLKHYITYKFESIKGTVETVPEHYTSQTCPACGNLYKPQNRTYRCTNKTCGFVYDRDGVGAINIFKKVSFGFMLDVVGGLTPPRGWKYLPQLACRHSWAS